MAEALIETFSRTGADTVHVLPNEDLVGHTRRGLTCVCGPRVQLLEQIGWLVTHHALDGRE